MEKAKLSEGAIQSIAIQIKNLVCMMCITSAHTVATTSITDEDVNELLNSQLGFLALLCRATNTLRQVDDLLRIHSPAVNLYWLKVCLTTFKLEDTAMQFNDPCVDSSALWAGLVKIPKEIK